MSPRHDDYWARVREKAAELGSDGCTGVPEFHHECCLEHDIHWRTGRELNGRAITTREANRRFRQCLQRRSKLGRWSPLAWWRWLAVSAMTQPDVKARRRT